ncbi:MAG: tail fiber domain-containing protein [Saprospiraceae bacterium]
MKSIIRIILTLSIVNYSFSITNAQIYVDADATGSNDGSSWTDAYTYLQDALAAASSGDEIWVAEGTYYPDEGASQTNDDRNEKFALVSGVSLFGGFSGIETNRLQAAPTENETILSGDIDQDGINTNNTYRVVFAELLTGYVTLDGFTIEKGYANDTGQRQRGGGLFNRNTEGYLTVSNCVFQNNYSSQRGGAVYNSAESAEVNTLFINCIFQDNDGNNGGAVHNLASTYDCLPIFFNCIFDSNTASVGGGGVFSWSTSTGTAQPVFTNCTFYNNAASNSGDAFKNSTGATGYFTNCIIWENGNDEWETASGATYIAYCTVNYDLNNLPSGTIDNGNNSESDPLFEDAANGDLRLQDSSPAADAGNNDAYAYHVGGDTTFVSEIVADLAGRPRIEFTGGTVDMGAYERPECVCNHTDGISAGSNISTGVGNAIYGEEAGYSLTTGSYNSLMGFQAGYSLTSADSSVMVGAYAGHNTTTGSKNIFVGFESGYSNTVGYNNIFLGTMAGYKNTTGYNNIAIGEEAGSTITTGFNNIMIGEHAYSTSLEMTGRDNIFIGNDIDNCTSGSYNVAIGQDYCGASISTGSYNVLYGLGAGYDVNTGNWNTLIGANAGENTKYSSYNTFLGSYAGWDNNRTNDPDNANYNTYIGDSCGYYNREGQYNVGIGADAGPPTTYDDYGYNTYIGADIKIYNSNITIIGYGANASKQYNVGIGAYSNMLKTGAIGIGYSAYINGTYGLGVGYESNVSGDYGIGIGYQSNVASNHGIAIGKNAAASGSYSIALGSGATATGYNSAAIGYGAAVSGNHEIVFGNTSTTTIGGTVDFTALSDGRFKTNIQENVAGLDFIRQLRPVTYQLMADDGRQTDASLDGKTVHRQSGFIAQEVEQAAQHCNFEFSGIDYREQLDKYGLRYAEFVVPLVKAVQELQPKIEQQQQTIQQQDARLDTYKAELLKLAEEIKGLEKE